MRDRAPWAIVMVIGAVLGVGVGALWWVAADRSSDSATAPGAFRAADGSITLLAPAQRRPAPTLAGTTLEGTAWQLSDLVGQVVVLNVWASWCAPCRAEAPALRAAAAEYAGRGATFAGINTRDSPVAAKAFERTYSIPYPSISDQDGQLLLQFAGAINPGAIPSTIVIDRRGRVAGAVMGRVSESTLRGFIEPLLAEPADGTTPSASPPATAAVAADD